MEGGCSYLENHSIFYKWEINDITSFINAARLTKVRDVIITSPKFSSSSKLKDSWHLELRIDKDSESSESKSWVSLYIMPNSDKKVRAKYIIYLLDNQNRKRMSDLTVVTESVISLQINDRFFDSLINGWGCQKFVKIDELLEKRDEFLKNDTLTVCIVLTICSDHVKVSNSTKPLEVVKRKLRDDFEDLFVAKKRCDVIIKVGNEIFDAHKLVLATRSNVFDAMFSHDMKENNENKVTLPDVDPQVFKKVLEFIYTDKIQELDNFAEELLEASDKYQLQGLQDMCESSLSKSLTFENAARRLVLADRHRTQKLKEAAIDYIAANWDIFETTEQFKQLEKSHSSLAYAIARKVISGFKTK